MGHDFVVGDILHTDNGDFLLIKIDCSNTELTGYGAIFIDDNINIFDRCPLGMQYFNEDFDEIIKNIEKDCKIIEAYPSIITDADSFFE